MKKLLFLATFLLAGRATAQCPYYATCPSDTSLFCDYSTNDLLFWNAAPFTWNPGLMLSDLPEAEVGLGIVAKDSCGGQNLSVQYTLFLDLDGNDTVETVVRSDAFPPAGKILYNNILSPNYALGDTMDFDHRVGLPDSMRYRFGLEIVRMADSVVATLKWTTGILSPNYSLPFFPLGKHRIQWRIEQGGVERFCEYGFEVKDCAPPVVTCASNLAVNISSQQGIVQLWSTDLYYTLTDNITPLNQVVPSVRKSGQNGTGFPLDPNGDPIEYVNFYCHEVGYDIPAIHEVEIWAMDKAGNMSSCVVNITVGDAFWMCNNDPTILEVCAKTPTMEFIENLTCVVDGTSSFGPPFRYTRMSGPQFHCARFTGSIPCSSSFCIIPSRNDNQLNGVTTYDLVLMSKHILATEPFNSPYKMIAADINKSGSITTFDILELRKLILGIYDSMPNNTSWRFVEKSFSFPNPLDPFATNLPDTICMNNWTCSYTQKNFTSIKIGDVNNTAIPNASAPSPTEERSPNFLLFPDCELKPGEPIDIPIRSTENAEWLGLQFSLEYDPELLDIESIESSILPDFGTDNWAQPRPGQVSLSWSDATAAAVSPDEPMLQLRIKARANIQLSRAFKTKATPRLQPEVYDLEGVAQPLQFVFSTENALGANQIFAPQPNPTTMGTSIPVQISQPENLRVEICNLSGKVLWDNYLALEKGSHLLEIPAAAMPHAGLYLWRVRVGEMLRAGKITRM